MKFIYCQDPLSSKQVDYCYEEEYNQAKQQGFSVSIIDLEALLLENNVKKATKSIPQYDTEEQAIYRGWMVTPAQYKTLYHELLTKNVRLINTPEEYQHCHHLPYSYDVIEHHTPKSVWIAKEDMNEDYTFLPTLLSSFGNQPLIVKDYVKSRKHEWEEACFIPDASDTVAVEKVVRCFVERQGEELNEGLVFRDFLQFEHLGFHPKSGMPLTNEHRLFFLNGKVLLQADYWEEMMYEEQEIPVNTFIELASRVKSNFFTMDVAKQENGEWVVVELGDGQVAGLPSDEHIVPFYTNFQHQWKG